ncbi:MAG: FG-GAP-like repeat-containing protein [Bacteroidota bacterium]
MRKTILPFWGLVLSCISGWTQPIFEDKTETLPLDYVSARTMDIASGDLDGDGDKDIVLAMEVSTNWILWNDGQGQFSVDTSRAFSPLKTYPQGFTGEDSEDIALFDLDKDDDLDLLFVTEDTDLHELYLNDGTGNFSLAPFQFPHPQKSNSVLVYDFNQDTWPDVMIGQDGANALYINQQDGTFGPAPVGIWPPNTSWSQDLKLVDVNGDNKLDIIEGADQGPSNLYLNQDDTFSLANDRLPPSLNNVETRKILPVDVDLDGDMDLFWCNVGWTQGRPPQDLLLINDGTGHFTDETNTRFPFLHIITLDGAFMDLNGDQYPDLILALGSEPTNHVVYLNDPANPGHFQPDPSYLPFMVLATTIAIDTADYNGDKLTDLYFGVLQSPDRLLLQTGPPTSIDADRSSHGFMLFPNPVTETLTVRYPQRDMADMYALSGQLIRKDIPVYDGAKIDVDQLIPGTYVLKLDAGPTLRFQKI